MVCGEELLTLEDNKENEELHRVRDEPWILFPADLDLTEFVMDEFGLDDEVSV